MGWLRKFIITCTSILAASIAGLVVLVATVDLGMSWHGIAAMFLGTFATLGLGMALMGLVFWSSRSEDSRSVHERGPADRGSRGD